MNPAWGSSSASGDSSQVGRILDHELAKQRRQPVSLADPAQIDVTRRSPSRLEPDLESPSRPAPIWPGFFRSRLGGIGKIFGIRGQCAITVLAAAKKIGIFPDLNPDLAGIPDWGNRESRFGRDRENKPRCPGIGDFGVWLERWSRPCQADSVWHSLSRNPLLRQPALEPG